MSEIKNIVAEEIKLTQFSHGAGCGCKISLIALAEAIRPKSKGSSTMGMKKSVVLIKAWPLPRS